MVPHQNYLPSIATKQLDSPFVLLVFPYYIKQKQPGILTATAWGAI